MNSRAAEAQPLAGLGESLKTWARVANRWLDTKSEYYSRMVEESVTRRTVLRVNLISLAMLIAIMAIETQPVVAIASIAVSGWLTYRLNHRPAEQAKKKGGRA